MDTKNSPKAKGCCLERFNVIDSDTHRLQVRGMETIVPQNKRKGSVAAFMTLNTVTRGKKGHYIMTKELKDIL